MRDQEPRFVPGRLAPIIGCVLLLAGAGCSAPSDPPKPPPRKNVILISLDAVRQDHISAFGYQRQTTPSIDWLALNGVAFRNVISTSCSPRASLTALLTAGEFTHARLEDGVVLRDANVTLAEVFSAAGYRTAAFVASPILAAEAGFGRGFATYMDFGDVQGDYVTADLPVRAAIDHLSARGADAPPFFLYLHLQEPHPPWRHASPWLTAAEPDESFFDETCGYIPSGDELALIGTEQKEHLIAKYDGALRFADDQIGALLKELRSRSLIHNTVIAVTTSHGLELLERFSVTHAYNPFDEVLRAFLVVFDQSKSFKDAIPRAVQARMFDVGPTLLGLAGIEKPAGIDGIDLLGAAQDVPEFAFAHCADADVVRSIEYKLIEIDLSRMRAAGKRIPGELADGTRFFALRSDPREELDASGSHPEQLARMQAALAAFRAALGPEPTQPAAGVERLKPATRERLRRLGYDAPG